MPESHWIRLRPLMGLCGLLLVLSACQQNAPSRGGSAVAADVDTDGDGLTDERERLLGTDPELADTDGDSVTDGDEVSAGTSPLARDSDRDGLEDDIDPEPTIPLPRPTVDDVSTDGPSGPDAATDGAGLDSATDGQPADASTDGG